jgi:glycosyltransferase involved in cell wall biosynthesis
MVDANVLSSIRIALAHYWYVTWRGGEKVTRAILDLFPNADIYTLFYDESVCGPHLAGHAVYSSVFDRPFLRKKYQKLFPLYPMGVRSLKLQGQYDLIVSSESGPIKGIQNPDDIPHLCYIHTPMRYCWGFTGEYLNALPVIARPLAKAAFESLRRYDETTVAGVTKYVANSQNVRDRVRKYYGRDASVVYPPISLDLFEDHNLVKNRISEREYYLSFGAITPYKGVGLLVDAFNKNGRKLVVIGEGSERKKLEAKANSNIIFTGALPYAKIREYILGAKALLFPGEEDFGMIPLEVMAHGVPVLAYARGGALETVVETGDNTQGTGKFFQQQSVDSLQTVIDQFEVVQDDFDPVFIRSHARLFGEDHFKERMVSEVMELLDNPIKKY